MVKERLWLSAEADEAGGLCGGFSNLADGVSARRFRSNLLIWT